MAADDRMPPTLTKNELADVTSMRFVIAEREDGQWILDVVEGEFEQVYRVGRVLDVSVRGALPARGSEGLSASPTTCWHGVLSNDGNDARANLVALSLADGEARRAPGRGNAAVRERSAERREF
jgi:hypothetical protein